VHVGQGGAEIGCNPDDSERALACECIVHIQLMLDPNKYKRIESVVAVMAE
jgi:hypothetical protein